MLPVALDRFVLPQLKADFEEGINLVAYKVCNPLACIFQNNLFPCYDCTLAKCTLAKWLLEFLGIPRNKGVNFHGKFGLGIPNHNNSGSKNLEIPRNSQKFPEIPSL